MRNLCVLGITGSIGLNVSDVCLEHQDDFRLIGVAFHSRYEIFEKVLDDHPSIRFVSCMDEKVYARIKREYPHLEVFFGDEGILELIDAFDYDMVVNALVGFAGLKPTLHTLNKGIDCALANKESLVVGGELINKILLTSNAKLYPIDSEHVALSKLLKNRSLDEVKALHITASGGSFRDLTRNQLKNVSVTDALNHPSWKMGAKVTIDSATMMNKGFEIIEAYYLFNIPLEKIKILMHDESIIHSALELVDHSFLADLGPADMRVPITYALYQGNYQDTKSVSFLDLADLGRLHFRKYDEDRYPAVRLAKNALIKGGSMPCVLNASNEITNLAFREGKITFDVIEEIIEKVMKMHTIILEPTLEDLTIVDEWARTETLNLIKEGRER